MNRKYKLFALILSLVFCLTVFTAVTAYALPEDYTGDDPVPSETEYVPPETEYVPPETEYVPPETETKYDPVPSETEYVPPETEAPVETQAPEENNDDQQDDYNYDDYSNYDYEERESNTTNEKAETAAVYDAEKDDVSTDTLKKSDWAKIAAQLKNANGDEGDDFAFIRNNDPNSGNNGDWMLILGILMEAVGVGIIIFLVVTKLRQKKAVKAGAGGGRGGNPPRGTGAPRAKAPQKQPHYAEKAPNAQRFTKKQRSKFDTADIAIPKHAKKPSGGTRYKPKH